VLKKQLGEQYASLTLRKGMPLVGLATAPGVLSQCSSHHKHSAKNSHGDLSDLKQLLDVFFKVFHSFTSFQARA
jgi:hypothetical protein